ncbi:MAG: orotidine-5'-phosphate decarboxylase [Bacteroidota bacterium]|nr:orotidine-5'-phosphate decarboxylase [Bacteroidota bacterium]
MNTENLINNINKKKSFLCVGLDTDINKIPQHFLEYENPVLEFNKSIIDTTSDLTVAYKLNTAFYESDGVRGWENLQKTLEYIPKDIFVIADAKRGDIGNTSEMYAKAFFEKMDFDAITVAPYMGSDSVKPFMKYKNKWIILLALTSNEGAYDFQFLKVDDNNKLFEKVLTVSKEWGDDGNMMYVVGATKAENLTDIRKIVPEHFLLIPGVGSQGGSLQDVIKYGKNKSCGLLVNSSRAIIYAGKDKNFAERVREETEKVQKEMSMYL